MSKTWAGRTKWQKGQDSLDDDGSSLDAVDQATDRLKQYLVNDVLDIDPSHGLNYFSDRKVELVNEVKQYFKTGNCGLKKSEARASVNPTFLQPTTGRWLVHYSSCPFESYLPIPLKIVDEKDHRQNGTVLLRYCQGELKKLLIAFRKRMERVKFYFHPCDALELCFDDSLPKFDLIDTSNLADHIGLVNLLTVGAQKLRSDQSILLTESMNLD